MPEILFSSLNQATAHLLSDADPNFVPIDPDAPATLLRLDGIAAASTTIEGVCDFSGELSYRGLLNCFGGTGVPVFGAGIRGVLLERIRTIGLTALTGVSGIHIPDSAFVGERLTPDQIRSLYTGFSSPSGWIVVKHNTDSQILTRVRLFRSALEFAVAVEKMAPPFIVQTFIEGPEVNYTAAVVGQDACIVPLVSLVDYKMSAAGDLGTLSGSMGAVVRTCVPTSIVHIFEALRPMLRDRQYTGLLELGTRHDAQGLALTEFSCRESTPEFSISLSMIRNRQRLVRDWLNGIPTAAEFTHQFGVGIVIAGSAYPHDGCAQGLRIMRRSFRSDAGTCILPFHTSVDKDDTWRTKGGRHVLTIGRANQLSVARTNAYRGAETVRFYGMQYRDDIGQNSPRLERLQES